jgi:LmbE family N-acetylglucosaminyl deacetylase
MTPFWDGRGNSMILRQPMNAVVVAHPDDEALWLSSVVGSVERIVFGFGAVCGKPRRSEARRRAVAALPLRGTVDLAIPESGVEWQSYLAQPDLTLQGVRIFESAVRERYESNHAKLLEGLRPALAGCQDVYTHNPWGEYGHAEHIQVYSAVTALQEELGYTVWFSNYVGPGNWTFVRGLAQSLSWAQRRVVRPDIVTARALMQVYRHHGAWTWHSGHRWPAQEILYAQPPRSSPDGLHLLSGEWLLDVGRLRWWRPPWLSPWRRLTHPDEALAPGSSSNGRSVLRSSEDRRR